ncbi:hypothetical protein ACFTS5_33425 [Nocardia sp. NPDC056952]|uniref:hypothetical protein n=1 Tax=Nocardia sp. NPDC056952 TaxID=3345979 RepID=UPI00364129F5
MKTALDTDGFVHIEKFLDDREIADLLRFAEEVGHGAGAGYFGKRLVTAIEDPSQIPAVVQEKLHKLQLDLFGTDMILTHSGIFSVDPEDPEHSVNFPFHQEHGSFYDFGQHLRYTNLYLVLDKEDISHSNVTVVPFSKLKSSDPELSDIAVGSGAARYTGKTRVDDNAGGSHTFRVDIDSIAHTPLLAPGDLLVLRGDIIHRTQNQKIKRTSISIRSVAADVVAYRETFDNSCGMKLAFMLSDCDYYGERDYIFETHGTAHMSARQLQEARSDIRRATEAGNKPAGLEAHVASFSARLRELQKNLQSSAQ